MERKYWQGKRIRIERKPVPISLFFLFFSRTQNSCTRTSPVHWLNRVQREREREGGKKSIEGEKIGNKSWEKERRGDEKVERGSYVIHAREGTGSSSRSLSFFRVILLVLPGHDFGPLPIFSSFFLSFIR